MHIANAWSMRFIWTKCDKMRHTNGLLLGHTQVDEVTDRRQKRQNVFDRLRSTNHKRTPF